MSNSVGSKRKRVVDEESLPEKKKMKKEENCCYLCAQGFDIDNNDYKRFYTGTKWIKVCNKCKDEYRKDHLPICGQCGENPGHTASEDTFHFGEFRARVLCKSCTKKYTRCVLCHYDAIELNALCDGCDYNLAAAISKEPEFKYDILKLFKRTNVIREKDKKRLNMY